MTFQIGMLCDISTTCARRQRQSASTFAEDSLTLRLTVESASRQIAFRINAKSPFLANNVRITRSGMISEDDRIT